MGTPWFEALRPVCEEACAAAGSVRSTDVVLFYVARWCQKASKADVPEVERLDALGDVPEVAKRITRNVAEDGDWVERLVAGDEPTLSELGRILLASARPRAGEAAREFAEEALQKVAMILLTGTPPSLAAERLREGPRGPGNEYVFQSPFEYWARSIVIRLVIDEHRRAARERRAALAQATDAPAPTTRSGRAAGAPAKPLDRQLLREAHDALPALVAAIRELPDAQRSAIVMSLARPEVDELIRERLHGLGPDLFDPPVMHGPSTDQEIAVHLGTTPQRLRSNRSLARGKLTKGDPHRKLLLDHLMPHASTRPSRSDA